jgi:excisionase family DNA binding protein
MPPGKALPPKEPKLLRLEEVAQRLGVSFMTVRNYIKQGLIKTVEMGNRSIRVEDTEIKRYLKNKEKKND